MTKAQAIDRISTVLAFIIAGTVVGLIWLGFGWYAWLWFRLGWLRSLWISGRGRNDR